jgi:thioredoxin reductase
LLDCAIVGGGPAGLNAALVLGLARRNVILFDNNNHRNAVTRESHGFIIRDGITPTEFRQIAHKKISSYLSVEYKNIEVISVIKNKIAFELVTCKGGKYQSKTISGPYRDRWELKEIHW